MASGWWVFESSVGTAIIVKPVPGLVLVLPLCVPEPMMRSLDIDGVMAPEEGIFPEPVVPATASTGELGSTPVNLPSISGLRI